MSRIAESVYGDQPYPITPGFKEETTSREAAKSVDENTKRKVHQNILDLIRERPRTADEISEALKLDWTYARPRVAELRAMGKIMPSGIRRPSSRGRSSIVWKLT